MSRRSRKWNFSSFDSVAVYIRTGTETRPKEITPDQIARGTVLTFPHAGRWETRCGARTPGTEKRGRSPPDGGLGARGPLRRASTRSRSRFFPVENPVDAVES